MKSMKTIVIGSGGREHAIAWSLARSPLIEEVVCVPGNGGTASEHKCRNLAVPVAETARVVEACKRELVGSPAGSFVVVGPEDPLAAGMADRLAEAGLRVVGPRQAGAELEASKDTAKRFMKKYGVACAASDTYGSADEAIARVREIGGPVVVKADGLAAGKGVVVAPDAETAIAAIREFMIDATLGSAGSKVVIEEYLEGEEVSILAAVSVTPELAAKGKARVVPFVTARDHKRLNDGAVGPNTGGMGAIAPADGVDEGILAAFRSDILEPTLRGLIAEKFDYRGFIFFGVMVTAKGPKLLEYNVRLGDPETQAVLPLMDFDFARMCEAIMDGSLDAFPFAWKRGYQCAPVAVSRGYPGSYPKGLPLSIDEAAVARLGAKVFVAGAQQNQRAGGSAIGYDGTSPAPAGLVTSGGRVLAASAFGETVDEARARAYEALGAVSFEGMFYRRDIGLPGAAVSKTM
jgi:phosphoribosylamine--glycine ligase